MPRQQQHMPWWQNLIGRGIDMITPGPLFNAGAPSFGQGFTSGGWNRAIHGDPGAIANVGLSLAFPGIGSIAGNLADRFIPNGDLSMFGNNNISYSPYGPYSSGYTMPAGQGPGQGEQAPYPFFDSQDPTQLENSPSAHYANGSSADIRGNGFNGGLSWGGGTQGAILSNLGMAGNVMQYGGTGGSPTGLNNLEITTMGGVPLIMAR